MIMARDVEHLVFSPSPALSSSLAPLGTQKTRLCTSALWQEGKYGGPRHSQMLQEALASPVLGEPRCLPSSQPQLTSRNKTKIYFFKAVTMCLKLKNNKKKYLPKVNSKTWPVHEMIFGNGTWKWNSGIREAKPPGPQHFLLLPRGQATPRSVGHSACCLSTTFPAGN